MTPGSSDASSLDRFLPSDVNEIPQTLLRVDPRLEPDRARLALAEMPRVRAQTAQRIASHLRGVLDLILFSGHRAQLTSSMHLLTVRENYRELGEKNTRLQEAFDRLKELDRLKSNFLATVSHELRTPLTSIIGYSEMLEAGIAGELSPEQGGFVETIRTKGELLLQLISSLLDLNKLERGQLKIKPEYIDPRRSFSRGQRDVFARSRKAEGQARAAVGSGYAGRTGGIRCGCVRSSRTCSATRSSSAKTTAKCCCACATPSFTCRTI